MTGRSRLALTATGVLIRRRFIWIREVMVWVMVRGLMVQGPWFRVLPVLRGVLPVLRVVLPVQRVVLLVQRVMVRGLMVLRVARRTVAVVHLKVVRLKAAVVLPVLEAVRTVVVPVPVRAARTKVVFWRAGFRPLFSIVS